MPITREKLAFKSSVKQACIELLTERIRHISQAMAQAQESANNQEKSSMGDKHETSRAISQAERDMNAIQLLQAKKDFEFIEAININKMSDTILVGSIFKLHDQLFFVAVGLGIINVGKTSVMVISHLSPLFQSLKTKIAGTKILFMDKEEEIKEVY